VNQFKMIRPIKQKSTVYKKIGLARHVACTELLQNLILKIEGDDNKIYIMKYIHNVLYGKLIGFIG